MPGTAQADRERAASFAVASWFNNCRLIEPIGKIPPAEAEHCYYAMLGERKLATGLNPNNLRQARGGSYYPSLRSW